MRDGARVARTRTAGYTDTAAAPGTTHVYTIRAVDPAGNESPPSDPASAYVPAAGELLFAPTDDAYVRDDAPSANFGAASTLQVDTSPVNKQFLLRFDVTGVGERTVESATLRLHAVDPSDRGGDFYLVEDDTWSEETVTWSSAPAGGILPVYSLGSVVKDNWYEVDVTSLVAGDGVVSLRAGSTSADGADYSSKEAGAGVAPELRVQTR